MPEFKYKTKQREEIVSLFSGNRERCFTAREICRLVGAGEATVFRTLSFLSAEGVIKKFSSGEPHDGALYQFNGCSENPDHFHLKCLGCGKLIHADCSFLSKMADHFREDHGFRIDNTQTVIYGLCESCGGNAGEAGDEK